MKSIKSKISLITLIILASSIIILSQEVKQNYLQDRNGGIPLSMFGTYIEKGEFLIYPFYEYYYDQDAEYSPQELGYQLDQDYFGKYRAHEGLIFLGYGISDYLAIEFEAAIISAKDPWAVAAEDIFPQGDKCLLVFLPTLKVWLYQGETIFDKPLKLP